MQEISAFYDSLFFLTLYNLLLLIMIDKTIPKKAIIIGIK